MPNKPNKARYFQMVGYHPMPHQIEYHLSEARYRVVSGGRRLGKSEMAGHDKGPNLFEPKNLGWIIGPTYDLGAKEFRVMWDDIIVKMKFGHDNRVKKNFNIKTGDMHIEMPWGARVEVRSSKYPDTLVGEGLSWVIYSEAAKHRDYIHERYVRGALADKRGTVDAISTPEGKNWFYKIWKKGIEGKEGYWSRKYPSWVNTVVFPGGIDDPEIVDLRDNTLEAWFDQEYGAEFSSVVGRILPDFQPETHVKKHVFRPDWPNYIAFDWGFANPLAAMEFQVAPDDTIWVWREHYKPGLILEDHIRILKARENPEGYRLDGAFGDVADPDAVATVSRHLVPCMADDRAKSNFLTGIRLYTQMLKPRDTGLVDEFERPIERPHYFVDPSCTEHISELEAYKVKDNVQASEFRSTTVVSTACEDHSIDAMRYGLMHLFEIGKYHLKDVQTATPNWAQARTTRETATREPVSSGAGSVFTYGGLGRRQRF